MRIWVLAGLCAMLCGLAPSCRKAEMSENLEENKTSVSAPQTPEQPLTQPTKPADKKTADPKPEQVDHAKDDDAIVIVCQNDLKGYIQPCNCAEGMIGGLHRRAAAVETLRAKHKHVLILDAGNLVADASLQSQFKLSTILESYQVIGCDALALGPVDIALGTSFLTGQYINHENIPLLSANAALEGMEDLLKPSRLITVGGMRVYVTALLDPVTVEGLPEVTVEDPETLTDRLMSEAGDADLKVLLAPVSLDTCRLWMESISFFDVIIGGTGEEDPIKPEKSGRTTLVCPGDAGKYLITLALSRGTDGAWTTAYSKKPLNAAVGQNEMVVAFYKQYQRMLGEASSEGLFDGQKTPHPDGAYVGNKACAKCHKKAYQIYMKSRHAHALETLEDIGSDVDPECLVCHTVGYRHTHGFISRKKTPEMTGVGCECCHGPGKEHSKEGDEDLIDPGSEENCLTCHNELRSPHYDFKTFYKKIEH